MNSTMDTHSVDVEHVLISRNVEGDGLKDNANAMC